jgi:hypothetical protein
MARPTRPPHPVACGPQHRVPRPGPGLPCDSLEASISVRTTIARVVLMALGMAFGIGAGQVVSLPMPATVAVAILCAGLLGMIPQRGPRVVAVPVAKAAPVAAPSAAAPPADPESLMPRWRRPSVQAARFGQRATVERAPMTFDARRASYESWEDESDAADGREVLRVRAAVATLLDVADEVLGDAVAELIRNDEVALLDSQGAFRLVVCPDGRRGWIHRTALVGGADEPATPDPDAPVTVAAAASR